LDKETAGLAERIGRALVAKGKKKVAVTDFVDLQGRPTELGRFLAEQLSVELVNAPGISVMDRANLRSILAEHKLSEEGLVNPETAKQLGQFAGVDVILIGTVTSLDANVAVTVKAVSTDTAEIVAASKVTFLKTREIQQLSVHGVSGTTSAVSSGNTSSMETAALAAKDLGDLRVTLKSIQRIKIASARGPPDGLCCVVEFTNRNLREPLLFAANGWKLNNTFDTASARSQLTDSAGIVWEISELGGLSVVHVVDLGSPSAIAEAIMYGRDVSSGTDWRFHQERVRQWMGDLATIPPGETVQASLTYTSQNSQNSVSTPADEVQFECEFVVGTGTKTSKTFRLYDLLWSNIKIPTQSK
jgi:TolB-like protein